MHWTRPTGEKKPNIKGKGNTRGNLYSMVSEAFKTYLLLYEISREDSLKIFSMFSTKQQIMVFT